MHTQRRLDLTRDLFLPTLLFMSVGGLVWAVRGCSGFGAANGCVFAGVAWGAAWWYIARDPSAIQSRRYASGWVVPALTIGIGLAGARGWMQWPFFWQGELMLNWPRHESVPASRNYGFLWFFIAGVPWAGLGACVLAWTGAGRPTRAWQWALRLVCGFGLAAFAVWLYETRLDLFLPLYSSLKLKYLDALSNPDTAFPNLKRLYNDNWKAMMFLGLYLGFLLFEAGRRDWKNVVLISVVGVVNGIGWALLQNWSWAVRWWPDATFNFGRCWETSGGLTIGLGYGLAFFLVNRPMSENDRAKYTGTLAEGRINLEWLIVFVALTLVGGFFMAEVLPRPVQLASVLIIIAFGVTYYTMNRETSESPAEPAGDDPNLERFGLYLGLLGGLGLSIRNGLKGWANIYLGNEKHWDSVLWYVAGPLMLLGLAALAVWILKTCQTSFGAVANEPDADSIGSASSHDYRIPSIQNLKSKIQNRSDRFPHAYAVVWSVILTQHIIGQLITGPGGLGRLLYAPINTLAPHLSVKTAAELKSTWPEMAYAFYYVLLFLITATVLSYVHYMKSRTPAPDGDEKISPLWSPIK